MKTYITYYLARGDRIAYGPFETLELAMFKKTQLGPGTNVFFKVVKRTIEAELVE